MLTKKDCLMLLAEIESDEPDKQKVNNLTLKAIKNPNVDLEVLKYINSKRQLDVSKFYEKLRYSYNHKKSKLYKNIVKDTEDVDEIITTLTSLLTQIFLYSKNCLNKNLFLKHSRVNEIAKVITLFTENYDITSGMKLLRLIKADLKCFESLKN
jgi:hypothetical protein